uniref:Uncharacterized protein n=1 Tax=Plectus sambesii TaxID=2011161 RepID=A0A914VP39_9BILA
MTSDESHSARGAPTDKRECISVGGRVGQSMVSVGGGGAAVGSAGQRRTSIGQPPVVRHGVVAHDRPDTMAARAAGASLHVFRTQRLDAAAFASGLCPSPPSLSYIRALVRTGHVNPISCFLPQQSTMGFHRNASVGSLCSHDADHKCEVCLATSSQLSVESERYSIQAPTQSFEVAEPAKSNIISEIVQAQLALWTFALSALFTYVWRNRRTYPIFNILVVLPTVLTTTAVLAGLLAVMVVVGRLFFVDPIDYSDWIVSKRPPTPFGSRKSSGASVSSNSPSIADDHNANYIWHRLSTVGDRPKLSSVSSRRSTSSNIGC